MRNIVFIIVFMCFGHLTFAQEEIILRGRLLSEDSVGIEMVNILNITHKYGTVTNTDGRFELPVYTGDTIVFSAVQYKNTEVYITDSILNRPFVERILEFENITLNDIVLTDGFSMLDTTPKTFGEIDMGLPFNTTPVKRKYSERREAYLTSKLSSSIISALTGDLKKLRRIQEAEERIALTEKVRAKFDDDFYEGLNIPKTSIYNFIDFYMPKAKSRGLLGENNIYELIAFIRTQAPLFLEIQKERIQSDTISD